MNEPVSNHCKGKMLQALTERKVITVQDTLQLQDSKIRGLEAFKTKLRDIHNIPVEIKNHSWFDLVCHDYKDEKFVRVRIQEILLFKHKVMLKLSDGMISPMKAMSIHTLWSLNHIVSDGEEEEEENDQNILFNVIPRLEILEIPALSPTSLSILKHCLIETNTLHNIHSKIH